MDDLIRLLFSSLRVSCRTILYLIFVLFLGAIVQRKTLLTDFMIVVRVSAIRVLLLAGIYVSSMSSCLGAMYGTPRVLQSIANESVIPGIEKLGKGVSGWMGYSKTKCDVNFFSPLPIPRSVDRIRCQSTP